MSNEIRFFHLNTGAKIPSVGLGTWQSDPGVVGQAIEIAVKAGYRHIDGSPIYGNEKEIGSALKKLFDDGIVKREDLWITSKLWNTEHAPEDVPLALERTLRDLQLDYVDLYLIHWPVAMKKESTLEKESVGFNSENILEPNISSSEKKGSSDSNSQNLVQPNLARTWKAMESLYDSGKARAIGVSNFSVKKLGDLLEGARIPPAVNQVEAHPSWRQDKLKNFCNSKGVHFSGYSPLGSPAWLKSSVLNHPILTSIAEKLGKTPAQVALRWGLQAGHSVLPKSANETRIKENLDIFDWSIPEDLFAKFSEIEQERLLRMDVFVHENYGGYKTVEELWDGEL